MIAVYATESGAAWSTRQLIWRSDFDSREVGIYGAKLKVELNKAGTLDFTVAPTHPYYHNFKQMSTILTVVCGDTVSDTLFRGRISKITTDTYSQKKITAEEVLIFLEDSVIRPLTKNQRKTPRNMFNWVMARHNEEFPIDENSQNEYGLNREKIFHVGEVDPQDPEFVGTEDTTLEKSRTYSENSYQTPINFIQNELIEEIGGYLRIRYDANYAKQWIDWLNPDKYIHAYSTTILPDGIDDDDTVGIRSLVFGSNIIEIQKEQTTEDLFTVLIPTGDNKRKANYTNNAQNIWARAGTYEVMVYGPDGVKEQIHVTKQGDALYIQEGMSKYGNIYHSENFSGATNQKKIDDSAVKYIQYHYKPDMVGYKIKAISQDLVNNPLRLGERVYVLKHTAVETPEEGLENTRLRVTQADYDLQSPDNSQYTIGVPFQKLTDKTKKNSSSRSKGDAENEGNSNEKTETSTKILSNSATDIFGSEYVERSTVTVTTTTTLQETDKNGNAVPTQKTTTRTSSGDGLKFKTGSTSPGAGKSVDTRFQKHRHVLEASSDNGVITITLGDEVYPSSQTYGDKSYVNFNMADTAWYQTQMRTAHTIRRSAITLGTTYDTITGLHTIPIVIEFGDDPVGQPSGSSSFQTQISVGTYVPPDPNNPAATDPYGYYPIMVGGNSDKTFTPSAAWNAGYAAGGGGASQVDDIIATRDTSRTPYYEDRQVKAWFTLTALDDQGQIIASIPDKLIGIPSASRSADSLMRDSGTPTTVSGINYTIPVIVHYNTGVSDPLPLGLPNIQARVGTYSAPDSTYQYGYYPLVVAGNSEQKFEPGDAYSAGAASVTLTKSWYDGTLTVAASNGEDETASLTHVVGTWDPTTHVAHVSIRDTAGSSSPAGITTGYSFNIDATSVYEQGQQSSPSSVTLQSLIVSNDTSVGKPITYEISGDSKTISFYPRYRLSNMSSETYWSKITIPDPGLWYAGHTDGWNEASAIQWPLGYTAGWNYARAQVSWPSASNNDTFVVRVPSSTQDEQESKTFSLTTSGNYVNVRLDGSTIARKYKASGFSNCVVVHDELIRSTNLQLKVKIILSDGTETIYNRTSTAIGHTDYEQNNF